MKPIVRSERSDRNLKKTWRRKGFNIYYDKNELSYEDNSKKCYKTLAFEYDFTIQDDTVQFAHGMPYDLTDLQRLLSQIKNHPKVKISSIGNTLMGRPIPLIRIAAVEEAARVEKKALVILARQHPGETPGSFIAEEMVMELLRNSSESDFLGWRFDIFIFPMVNQDGV
jgi:cytosolic carboxypeptidase protein 2/3